MSISGYLLKIKLLDNKLERTGCGLSEEEKLMSALGGLDESYDNVFSTLIERMLTEIITVDDAKAKLSHEC